MTDEQLGAGVLLGEGIGGPTSRLDVDGVPVFVKRVPLTDLELANPLSTANLFGLPTYYQYGVGSAGFGAWRELVAHQRTTAFVLEGGVACFPLLYHWRVLPRLPGAVAQLDARDPKWQAPQVLRRVEALEQATSSLLLCLEFVPQSLVSWLADQEPEAVAVTLEAQLLTVAEALLDNGLLHLDSHVGNLLWAGNRLLITDFGLVTSAEFELDDEEQKFVRQHVGHDRAFLMAQLVNWLVRRLVPGAEDPAVRNAWIAGRPGGTELPPAVLDVIDRHAAVAGLVNAFYWRLHAGELLTAYPYEQIDQHAG